MKTYIDVRDFGTTGDGITDDTPAFLEALYEHGGNVVVPPGTYIIGKTLRLKSNTHIFASPEAHIMLAPGAQHSRFDFLLTNDDPVNGNENISITGGIWDGNSAGNDRGRDMFNPEATTGALFSFLNVNNLSLADITLKNPLCYYMRFCKADSVKIENIRFNSEGCHLNQDGIHLAGFCSNFVIRNLYGTAGSPGDDFIAINADDYLLRQENFDMLNGDVDNVLVENIYSENCHCFVRLLSVSSRISNVTINNVSGHCRGNVINMDAGRYCRTPLFDSNDPVNKSGVGFIENVKVSNVSIGRESVVNEPYFMLETNCSGFSVNNYVADCGCVGPTVSIKNLSEHTVSICSKSPNSCQNMILKNGDALMLDLLRFSSLELNKNPGSSF